VPLPGHYGNSTNKTVSFTTTMKANRLFGPDHVASGATVQPGIELVRTNQFVSPNEATPLGSDKVVVEVTSSATGTTVIARCTFNLTVTRRPETRNIIGIPLRPCFLEGTELASNVAPGQLADPQDVVSIVDKLTDQTWLKFANIAFRVAPAPGVPV